MASLLTLLTFWQSERRCDMLLREKENLATELWKLRQQVEDLMNSKSEFGSELGGGSAASANLQQKLDSYRADNPEPMQRKIGKFCDSKKYVNLDGKKILAWI